MTEIVLLIQSPVLLPLLIQLAFQLHNLLTQLLSLKILLIFRPIAVFEKHLPLQFSFFSFQRMHFIDNFFFLVFDIFNALLLSFKLEFVPLYFCLL